MLVLMSQREEANIISFLISRILCDKFGVVFLDGLILWFFLTYQLPISRGEKSTVGGESRMSFEVSKEFVA